MSTHRIVRVFLAHPKDVEPDVLEHLLALVKERLTGLPMKDGSVCAPQVTAARDSFLDWEKQHGKPVNWHGWIEHVTGNAATFGTEPRFHVFVVGPDSYCGKATAEIIQIALLRGRRILRVAPGGRLERASKVSLVDDNSWKRGWIVA